MFLHLKRLSDAASKNAACINQNKLCSSQCCVFVLLCISIQEKQVQVRVALAKVHCAVPEQAQLGLFSAAQSAC